MYEIVPAKLDHAIELGSRMRQADIDEVFASHGISPSFAATAAFSRSREPMTGVADGNVVCMFGVEQAHVMSDCGRPWLLGTDLIDQHARAFLPRSKVAFEEMRGGYSYLTNYADVRNRKALRWLRWLGFEMSAPARWGFLNMPFQKFWWGQA